MKNHCHIVRPLDPRWRHSKLINFGWYLATDKFWALFRALTSSHRSLFLTLASLSTKGREFFYEAKAGEDVERKWTQWHSKKADPFYGCEKKLTRFMAAKFFCACLDKKLFPIYFSANQFPEIDELSLFFGDGGSEFFFVLKNDWTSCWRLNSKFVDSGTRSGDIAFVMPAFHLCDDSKVRSTICTHDYKIGI